MGLGLRTVTPVMRVALVIALVIVMLPGIVTAQPNNQFAVDLQELPRGLNLNNLQPPELQRLIRYEGATRQLVWTGASMSETQKNQLLQASNDGRWQAAVNELYEQAKPQSTMSGGGGVVERLLLREFPLTEVLLNFARQYTLNIVCSRDVAGNVTLQLNKVTVPVALDAILRSQGYEYQVIKNPVEDAPDVFIVVTLAARIPDLDEAVIPIPPSEPGKAPLEFEPLIEQLNQLSSSNGSIVSNSNARVMLVQDTPQAIRRMQNYIAAVRRNLPDRALTEAPEVEITQPTGPTTPDQQSAPAEVKRLYRIPGDTENVLEALRTLLGTPPEVINQREAIVMIEETEAVHALVADYIAKIQSLSPPEPPLNERLDTRVYTLRQTADTVQAGLQPFLTPDKGKIVVNPALNSLIVTDLVTNFDTLERYVRELDATPQQVLIESTILEATLDDSTDFGVSAFWNRGVGSSTLGYGSQGSNFDPSATADLPFTQFSSSTFNFGFIQGSEWEVALNAVQTTLDANILSRPKLVVANNTEGTVKVGTEIPYIDVQGGASGATQGVQFKPVDLEFVVTPHIEPGDRIRLELNIQVDARAGDAQLGGVGSGTPIISSRAITTEVYVNDGETLVIGGLYEDRQSDTVNKVPILGDLPVLGALFRTSSLTRQRTDLLFIITPTIVREHESVSIQGVGGRELRVFRPDAPQIPEWYRDRNYSRLRGTGEVR